MFLHGQSAGHGLSLQDGGNIMVFFTLDFNLEFYLQVIERIGPMRQLQSGHARPTILHHVIAEGTVDEHVLDVVTGRKTMQEAFTDALLKYQDDEKMLRVLR
jgi:hypothetical protein